MNEWNPDIKLPEENRLQYSLILKTDERWSKQALVRETEKPTLILTDKVLTLAGLVYLLQICEKI